jgi:serine/threonine protein kinase
MTAETSGRQIDEELRTQFGVGQSDERQRLVNEALKQRAISVAVDYDDQFYYLTEKLGSGGYGAAYRGFFEDDTRRQLVIKRIETGLAFDNQGKKLLRANQTTAIDTNEATGEAELVVVTRDNGSETRKPFRDATAEIEYLVSLVARKQLGESVCGTRLVCVDKFFYARNLEFAFTVAPYQTSFNLFDYARVYIHADMRSVRDKYRERTGRTLRDAADLRDDAKLAKQYRKVVNVCLAFAIRLATTVTLLHSKDLVHNDIKPVNIIVDNPTEVASLRVVLIDFGKAFLIPSDNAALDPQQQSFLKYRNSEASTPSFQDPLAYELTVKKLFRRNRDRFSAEVDAAGEMYRKFDTYALGKTFQVLFDDARIPKRGAADESGVSGFVPVRQTPFMSDELYQLLVDMTGEPTAEPPRNDDGTALDLDTAPIGETLSQAEYERRKPLFDQRPSMRAVLRRLDSIVRQTLTPPQ